MAVRIGRTTPELIAGVNALLCHTTYHGFATERTQWRPGFHVLLGTPDQPLGRQSLGETAFLAEGGKLLLYLLAEHGSQPVAKHNDASGHLEGVAALQPCVEALLLSQYMDAALILQVIIVSRLVKLDGNDLLVLCRMD